MGLLPVAVAGREARGVGGLGLHPRHLLEGAVTTLRPDPRRRRSSSSPRCQPVLSPWMPAPMTTAWTLLGSWLIGTSRFRGLPGGPDLCTTRLRSSSSQGRFRGVARPGTVDPGLGRPREIRHASRSGNSARHDSGAPARRSRPSGTGGLHGAASTARATRGRGRREVRADLAVEAPLRFVPHEDGHVRRAADPFVLRSEALLDAAQRFPGQQRVAEALREPVAHGSTCAERRRRPATAGARPSSTVPARPSGRGTPSRGSAAADSRRTARPLPDSRAGCRSGRRAPTGCRRGRTRGS